MTDTQQATCQVCWAKGQQVGRPCWLCHNRVTAPPESPPSQAPPPYAEAVDVADLSATSNPYETPSPPPVVEDTYVYQASSFLLIAIVLVTCLVFALMLPGFGIPLSVILVPALIRTVLNLHAKQAKGKPVTTADQIKTFFLSAAAATAAAFTAAIACIGAFFSACLIACAGASAGGGSAMFEQGLTIMMGVSVLIAVGVGIYMFLQLTSLE